MKRCSIVPQRDGALHWRLTALVHCQSARRGGRTRVCVCVHSSVCSFLLCVCHRWNESVFICCYGWGVFGCVHTEPFPSPHTRLLCNVILVLLTYCNSVIIILDLCFYIFPFFNFTFNFSCVCLCSFTVEIL